MTVQLLWADIEAIYNQQKQYNPRLSSVDQIYNEPLATTKSLAGKLAIAGKIAPHPM